MEGRFAFRYYATGYYVTGYYATLINVVTSAS